MKNLLLAPFVVLGFSAVPAFGSDPIVIPLPVEKIYVPHGFDDNDVVEIAMKGFFRSSCFKVGQSSVKVDHVAKTIVISSMAYEYDGVCADVVVPFLEIAKVGPLKSGTYAVTVANRPSVLGSIDVRRRITEAPDDHLYAPVAEATVEQEEVTRHQNIHLRGVYPLSPRGCMKITDVRTYMNPPDVLVVLPIAEMIETSECNERQGNQNFDLRVPMAAPFFGAGLLHVRVLNGTSINRFIELY